MKILITGVAGFIGFSTSQILLKNQNLNIVGIDNFSSYSGNDIKKLRIKLLKKNKNFLFKKIDINSREKIKRIVLKHKFDIIIHLAAEVGVRYSIEKPEKYIKTNIQGFFNIINSFKFHRPTKFMFASSSSVYGDSRFFPLHEKQILNPKNIYALTKKNNEEIAKIYSKKYRTTFIGLRFFTVYGEFGRPDMFFYKMLYNAFNNKVLYLNNSGNHYRDFTYIKDVVNILKKLVFLNFKKNFEVFNICSSKPIFLKRFVHIAKKYIKNINIVNVPPHPADVYKTHGSNKKLIKFIKKIKFTNLDKAIKDSIKSYKKYKIYQQKN